MRTLPYNIGDVFAVPLRGREGYALGVIARAAKGGRILLGYFYDRYFLNLPDAEHAAALLPHDAVLTARFGDLGLFNGEWRVLSHISNWDERQWPVPKFLRREPTSNRTYLITYSDKDPSVQIAEDPVTADVSDYGPNGLYGAGAIEILLTKIIADRRYKMG